MRSAAEAPWHWALPPRWPLPAFQCFRCANAARLSNSFFGAKDYAPAIASIASIRAAFGYILLPPETHRSVAAAPGLDLNFDFINEHQRY